MRKIATKLQSQAAPPILLSAPTISGTAQVGKTLSALPGNCTNRPRNYAYQWQNEGSNIAGATSGSYTLQTSDLGALITVMVTPSNGAGSGAPARSALAGPVISKTAFYVSSSTGSDSNPGTLALPWKTIAHVNAQTFAPGTSVLFKRGDKWDRSAGPTVTGTFLPTGGGTIGNPIVYDAYGTGPNPIIDGSADGWGNGNTALWTNIGTNLWESVQTFPPTLTAYSTFPSLTIGQPIVANLGSTINPVVNGSVIFSSTGGGITAGTVYYITNPSGFTFNISATPGGAAINATSTTQPAAQYAGVSGFPYWTANDVGNILWGFAPLGGSAPAAVNTASFGTMVGAGVGGVWYSPGEGTTTLAGGSQGDWNFNTDNFRVQIYSTTNPAIAMPGLRLVMDGAGILSWSAGFTYLTFQNFTFQNIGASAAIVIKASNTIFRDNVVQWVGGGNVGGGSGINNRAGDAFDPGGAYSGILCERNYFYQTYDVGIGPQTFLPGSHDNFTIRNNIFQNNAQAMWFEPSSTGTLDNTNIFNNTSYGGQSWSANQRPNGGGGAAWGFVSSGLGSITAATLNIENNAFSGASNFGILIHSPLTDDFLSFSPVVIDYNSWSLLTGTGIQFGNTGTGNITMASWRTTYGFETHGLIDIDPAFANQSGANFTPSPASPLRNAGANLFSQGVVWDFNHQPRPISGPFTIGAFQ